MQRIKKKSFEISWVVALLGCFLGLLQLGVQLFATTENDAIEDAFTILQTLPTGYSECGSNFTLYQITDGSTFLKITMNNNCDQSKLKSCEVMQGRAATEWAQGLERYIIDGDTSENIVLMFGVKRDFDILLEACQQIMQLEGALTTLDIDMSLIRRTRKCTGDPNCGNRQRSHEGHPMIPDDDVTPLTEVHTDDEVTDSNEIPLNPMFNGIYPGTLWCGVGNIADDVYTRLGKHAKADECCRLHDLCKPTIRRFQARYQLYNPTLLRISHCSCDREFYNCLKRAKTEAASDIGDLFFNTLRLTCFEFDFMETCTWKAFGVCLRSEPMCSAKVGRITDF